MKVKSLDFFVFGYLLLLVVNAVEIRSGLTLASIQLVLGLTAFYPQLIKSQASISNGVIHRIIKALLLLSLIFGIYLNWYDAPNHLYLFTFLTMLMIFRPIENETVFLRENMRWIFIILMAFATVHKFIHLPFISGDFVGLRTLTGSFFRPLHLSGLSADTTRLFADNVMAISNLGINDPVLGEKTKLAMPMSNFAIYAKGFTYIIAFTELLLAVMLILIPYKKITSIFLLVFICSIGLVVSEFEFMATLLLVGTVLSTKIDIKITRLYKGSFIFYSFIAIVYNLFQHLR